MKKTAIITLTFNKLEEATKPFLNSLYEFTPENDFDLIIVDNGSKDGTKEFLQEFSSKYKNIKLIFNEENLGYSKGNNIGIKEALKGDYGYIGLLNNDILFTPDWLKDTLNFFNKDEKIGLISPRIQKKKEVSIENYLTKYKSFLAKYKNNLRYTIEPLFCCVLAKKEVIEKIGLLDENFTPAFFEDNDYCFRTLYQGFRLAICNRTFVFHNHSTTSKSISNEIFERNKKYFFEKHPLGKYIFDHKKSNIIKDILGYIKEAKER